MENNTHEITTLCTLSNEIIVLIFKQFVAIHGFKDLFLLKHTSFHFKDLIEYVVTNIQYLGNSHVIKNITGEQLKQFTNLTSLDLSKNNLIKDDDIKDLPLKNLNLTFNKSITNEGIKNMPLHTLYLNANNVITNEGIKNLPLHTLYLNLNDVITNEGIKNMFLHTLYLNCNRLITIEGIKGFPLRVLSIYGNSLITKNNIKNLTQFHNLHVL